MVSIWRCLLFALSAGLLSLGFCVGTAHVQQSNNLVLNPDERDPVGAITPSRVSGWAVLMNSSLMSLANCLGALPFLFVHRLSGDVVGVANGIACGVMLACSFDLIHEGEPYGSTFVILGILIGMICVKYCQAFLEKYEDVTFEALQGADARKILLVLGIMAAHAVGEGAGVGVSYAGSRGWSQGMLVTLAIGLHNIPEGLAVATVLIARGVSVRKAMVYNAFVAIPQAIVALPAYLFVETFTVCLPLALGFAAGCMIWVVFSELLPDAFEHAAPKKVATVATLSAIWLEAMRVGLRAIEGETSMLFGIGGDWMTVIGLASIAVCLSVSTAIILRLKVRCVVGLLDRWDVELSPDASKAAVGIGMQSTVGIALFLKEMAKSHLPTISSFAWLLLGIVVSIVDWQPVVDRFRRMISKSINRDALPSIMTRSNGDLFDRLYQDPIACKILCCLLGIGVVEGIHIAQSTIGSYDLFASVGVRSIVFGCIVGFWSLSLRCRTRTGIVLSILVALWPAIVLSLVYRASVEIGNRLTALTIGSVLMNVVRLMLSRHANPDTTVDNELRNHTSSHTLFDVPTVTSSFKRRFICRPSFFFGAIIAFGCLTLSGALCRWDIQCL